MVNPVLVDQMLQVLRKHDVAHFKCADFELVLDRAIPQDIPLPASEPDRGVAQLDLFDPNSGLFDHLGTKPKFADKPPK